MKTRHMLMSAAALAALVAVHPSVAQQERGSGEAAYLRSFEGRFSGSGTLQEAGGASRPLTCEFEGDEDGSRLSLTGSCRAAAIFSATIRIDLRYDPKTERYDGAFRESTGTVADLAGERQGQRLTLAFTETAESTRPDPPATLTITRRQDGIALTLRNSRPGEGQSLDLSLSES